jgi:hypothetical protein
MFLFFFFFFGSGLGQLKVRMHIEKGHTGKKGFLDFFFFFFFFPFCSGKKRYVVSHFYVRVRLRCVYVCLSYEDGKIERVDYDVYLYIPA